MKKLILVRHAKSSWNDVSQPDFERSLNERGLRDAPEMAARLLEKEISPDALVSSPALRALTTAENFASILELKKKRIHQVPSLYLAGPDVFIEVVSGLEDDWKTVVIFSHNPGITEYANSLCTVRIDDMATCAMYAVKADVRSWKDFAAAEKHFWFFDYPKAKF